MLGKKSSVSHFIKAVDIDHGQEVMMSKGGKVMESETIKQLYKDSIHECLLHIAFLKQMDLHNTFVAWKVAHRLEGGEL
jgi:hypothetical protein